MRAKPLLLARAGSNARRAYPWRCLCFGFSQMMRTTPFRRTTLHFAQTFLTDGLTFIVIPSYFVL